jgi:hypothetical protein
MSDRDTPSAEVDSEVSAKIERAIEIANARTIERHRRQNLPLAVWRDGRVVVASADELYPPGVTSPDELAPRALAEYDVMLGLAAFRTDAERRLRSLAGLNGFTVDAQRGAREILHLATDSGLLPSEVTENLQRALSVADRVLHGASVSESEIKDAIRAGERSLAAVEERIWSQAARSTSAA